MIKVKLSSTVTKWQVVCTFQHCHNAKVDIRIQIKNIKNKERFTNSKDFIIFDCLGDTEKMDLQKSIDALSCTFVDVTKSNRLNAPSLRLAHYIL